MYNNTDENGDQVNAKIISRGGKKEEYTNIGGISYVKMTINQNQLILVKWKML